MYYNAEVRGHIRVSLGGTGELSIDKGDWE